MRLVERILSGNHDGPLSPGAPSGGRAADNSRVGFSSPRRPIGPIQSFGHGSGRDRGNRDRRRRDCRKCAAMSPFQLVDHRQFGRRRDHRMRGKIRNNKRGNGKGKGKKKASVDHSWCRERGKDDDDDRLGRDGRSSLLGRGAGFWRRGATKKTALEQFTANARAYSADRRGP